MATKLTKAFAEFVGGRGFLIANEGEISQQPGEDYKLARQISLEGGRRVRLSSCIFAPSKCTYY